MVSTSEENNTAVWQSMNTTRAYSLQHLCSLESLCADLKSQVGRLVEVVLSKESALPMMQDNVSYSTDQSTSLASLSTPISDTFLKIAQLNRELAVFSKNRKQGVVEKKLAISPLHLNLQNLNYERFHLEKEIQRCEQTETIYQDIQLCSIDEFKKALGKHDYQIGEQTPAKQTENGSMESCGIAKESDGLEVKTDVETMDTQTDDIDKMDPHALMIHRLTFELNERKRLATVEQDLIKKKNEIRMQYEGAMKNLDRLDEEIDGLVKSSIPLQKRLGMAEDQTEPDESEEQKMKNQEPECGGETSLMAVDNIE